MGLIRDFLAMQTSPVRPFHDDPFLQQFMLEEIQRLGIKSFVETGAFRGDSLSWIADRFDGPCYSCEINSMYYKVARLRTGLKSNVILRNLDSRIFLEEIAWDVKTPMLLWLDAHWGKDWPLVDELRFLQKGDRYLALIDDFQIPGRPEFGFDTYDGQPLNFEFIQAEVSKDCLVGTSDYPAPKNARGVCVIYRGLPRPPLNSPFKFKD